MSSCMSSSVSSETMEDLLNQLPDLKNIMYDSQTLQALIFMAGYTVHKFYMRSTKCSMCLKFLAIDKEFLFEQPPDSKYTYLEIVDRGSLKWPSDRIVDAVVVLWRIFVAIDGDNSLMSVLIQGASRQILVSLGIKHIENNLSETWRNACPSCYTPYWDILKYVYLYSIMANCLISNKVKNFNSHIAARGDNSRKANKFTHI